MALVICMESEKPMTITSGVITFKNRLSLNPAQPSAPSDQTTASSGGTTAINISDKRL